jgi:hypothetical protein
MKSRFHFDNIKVAKQIKFYSEYKLTEKEITWLSKSDKTITPWDPGYIISFDELNHANNAQKDFYHYFKEFFFSEAEYEYHHQINLSQTNLFQNSIYYNSVMTHVVENAIKCQIRKFVLKSEDLYRESIGLPKIGEGWISETELYYKISNAFKLEVSHHGRPKWLGIQHLDVYIPELNLAFEYQGIQHYEPIDYFGGINGLLDTKRRDELKRINCRENGLTIIYVYPDYNFEYIKHSIQRRILFNQRKGT